MNDYYAFKEKRRKEKEKQSKYYDQHTKEMKELRSGEVVRMLTDEKWKPATVLKNQMNLEIAFCRLIMEEISGKTEVMKAKQKANHEN